MSKIELDDITSGYSVAKINNNFQKIEDEINNKMLSRQPNTEPNVMLDVLDMNSNRIINLPAPVDPTDPIRLMDVDIDISGVTIDSDFALIRASAEPTALDGKMWFDKVDGLYVGDEGQWKPVGGGSNATGGGIIYSDVLPASLKVGDTYFDASRMENVYSYADDDSVQYLATPLLVGSGGGTSVGGSASGFSTFTTADLDGASLVGIGSTPQDHKIKSIKAGAGVTLENLGGSVVVKADLVATNAIDGIGLVKTTDGSVEPKKSIKKLIAGTGVTLTDDVDTVTIASTGGGGTGGGIIYAETVPGTIVPGDTYYIPNTGEQVFSYDDGDSSQYLAYPLLGGSPAGSTTGGGSSINLANAGTTPDGAGVLLPPIGDNYYLRRFKAGPLANVVVTESGNSVLLEGLDVVNAGASGLGLVKTKTATQYPIKRLVAGTNVTLTDGTDSVTINATGTGGALGDTLTRLSSITAENNNVPVFTASGATQFLTTASTRALMGLSTTANTIPMFTGSTTATLATLTPFMVSMLEKTGVPSALAHLKITSGSNANGSWLRIGTADTSGIQICWNTITVSGATTQFGSVAYYYSPSDSSWTFPQAFGATPAISAFPIGGNLSSIISGAGGASASAATFRQGAPGTTSSISATVIAVGVY